MDKTTTLERKDAADLYFEAHITIDPVEAGQREAVQALVQPFKFKLAKLLMDKGVPSELDTFMTGHNKSLSDICRRVQAVVELLKDSGIRVRRYKIEDTVLDSRTSAVFGLLPRN